ncbi:metallopeptidase TldD-related protein [Skermania piniformis]|uniref:TldD/PmbA family protein n=1 Tax=Skermania pinensis TaxID=39122 RepID=A0ABX8SDK0_9ACTN|nr:metallopeptidase TldD-related protein [Skermania piniformis]QXQ15506.1 TldD/PmbA family protein [Skermania piniformis]
MIAADDVVDRALAASRADETVVIVADTAEASLRWAGNSMTTNGRTSSRSWTVVSIDRTGEQARVGSVSSTSVDPSDIEMVVRASEAAAADAEPAADAMSALAAVTAVDGPAAPVESPRMFERLAAPLAEAFSVADKLYGFALQQITTTTLGTSAGLRRRYTDPTGSIELNGKRGAGASAWVGAHTKDFADVDVPTLLAELDTRLDWTARRVELPAGRYDTVLPPSPVADLMIDLMWSMEGRGAEEGHTAFTRSGGGTRVGERLTDLPLTLRSDPHAAGLEYAPFVATGASSEAISVFDNGMPIERVDWIRDGTIGALAYPRSAAAEFGAPVAVPGENLLLTGGSAASTADLVADVERGLLLTTLWYIRMVDPITLLLTGLTRDGVYLIEDGAVTAAVNNFRFNESPLDLLRRVRAAGATVPTLPREWKDWFTRTAMPPLRIPDFHMSSVSPAT